MENVILNYISKNYKHTLNGAINFTLLDINTDTEQDLAKILSSLYKIFSIDKSIINEILMKWVEDEITKLNNIITDIRYKIYEKTGLTLELTHNDLVKLIDMEYDKTNNHVHI